MEVYVVMDDCNELIGLALDRASISKLIADDWSDKRGRVTLRESSATMEIPREDGGSTFWYYKFYKLEVVGDSDGRTN